MYNYLKEEKNVYWGYTEKAFKKLCKQKTLIPWKQNLQLHIIFSVGEQG